MGGTASLPLMALGAQEEEDPDESGCEEEEGREDEDEDSGSEESLVDSDSDPEGKGACAWAGSWRNCSGQLFWLGELSWMPLGWGQAPQSPQMSVIVDGQGPEP